MYSLSLKVNLEGHPNGLAGNGTCHQASGHKVDHWAHDGRRGLTPISLFSVLQILRMHGPTSK